MNKEDESTPKKSLGDILFSGRACIFSGRACIFSSCSCISKEGETSGVKTHWVVNRVIKSQLQQAPLLQFLGCQEGPGLVCEFWMWTPVRTGLVCIYTYFPFMILALFSMVLEF